MHLLTETKNLCKKYDIRPARSKGQNFLIKEDVYKKITEAAGLSKDDTVLEVGPGLGFLTEKLACKVKRVIAVELDDKLAGALRERLAEQGIANVEVVNEDILKISKSKLFQIIPNQTQNPNVKNYKIVANLPYNITSRFLRKFLSEVEQKPSLLVLLLQKEVVERLTAKPGQMSLLAVSVQFYAASRKVMAVPKSSFWPQPKVDSAVVELEVRSNPSLKLPTINKKLEVDERKFFRLVKIGFSSKRKQLQGNLTKGLKIKREDINKILAGCGFKATVRAQELSVEDWKSLLIALQERNVL